MDLSALIAQKDKLAVIGLGYVGLPVALAFAEKFDVIGFDTNAQKINLLRQGIDPSQEIPTESFKGKNIRFTTDREALRQAVFFVVTVPTPVDTHCVPDLTNLFSASETISKVLKKGDCVVFESTVYPGCTDEDIIPFIEKQSKLIAGEDFFYGYSPERINPGDRSHRLRVVKKIVSGCNATALTLIRSVYSLILDEPPYEAGSIKIAEAAKIIENTQRDINIALMNELARIFERMGLSIYDVLDAASTKWNFLPFNPGLVGGHCIGVDPYYLTYKALALGYHAQVITAGRNINDTMASYLASVIFRKLLPLLSDIRSGRLLVMGMTFKENVSDIRNSKTVDLINQLKSYGLTVDVADPIADPIAVHKMYGFSLQKKMDGPYDCIVLSVPHRRYCELDDKFFCNITSESALICDIKGVYRNKIKSRHYWTL